MKEIIRIFKNNFIYFLIAIVLLVFQANLELELPEYTADIVNVGIQQQGIKDCVFNEISSSSMNRMLLFSSDDEEILSYYEQVKVNKKNIEKYPILKEEGVYVLKNDVNISKLEDLLIDPIFIYNAIENMIEKEVIDKYMPVDYVNKEAFYNLLNSLSDEEINSLMGKYNKAIHSISKDIKKQSNINFISKEYVKIGIDIESRQLSYLYLSGFRMLAISLLIMLLAIFVMYFSSMIGSNFSYKLRDKLVRKIMSFSNKEFEQFSTASLITRTTNDVQQIQMLIIMLLRIVVFAPIMGLGALSKISNSNMAWIIGLAILIILVIIITLFILAFPKFKVIQNVIDRVNLVSREIINGLPVIRAFSNEKYENNRFDIENKKLTKINVFVNRVMVLMMPFLSFIMNIVAIFIIWFGAKNVNLGLLQVGDLMAYITYSIQIIISFIMVSMVSIILPRAIVSLKRISEVFNTESTIKNPSKPKKLKSKKNITVTFDNVSFMYHDAEEYVLENVSFQAAPGTVTAIIGSTGCGKSTLVNLIPRFFDVTDGSIKFNNVDIRDLSLSDLRGSIGYVPQKGYLFSGTIKSNIKFSNKKITDDEMKSAAKIAQASKFISSKTNKFDEEISQGGSNVSGGQKQRLAIARALSFKPSVLIFDDSFSALDFKTEANLRKSIKKNVKDATVFIVAQRINTVIDADQIIVLEDGKIVGLGKHTDLLKTCDTYKEIAYSQLSEEELS